MKKAVPEVWKLEAAKAPQPQAAADSTAIAEAAAGRIAVPVLMPEVRIVGVEVELPDRCVSTRLGQGHLVHRASASLQPTPTERRANLLARINAKKLKARRQLTILQTRPGIKFPKAEEMEKKTGVFRFSWRDCVETQGRVDLGAGSVVVCNGFPVLTLS